MDNQINITPITDLVGEHKSLLEGEDAFTPVTRDNAYIESFRLLCRGYGSSQDLTKGCTLCILQLRCLNAQRVELPFKIEQFKKEKFDGNPFLGEATRDITESNIEKALVGALEDLVIYEEDGDPLNKERILKLLVIYAKEHLSSIDPRVPLLLLEKLLITKKVEEREGLYYVVK